MTTAIARRITKGIKRIMYVRGLDRDPEFSVTTAVRVGYYEIVIRNADADAVEKALVEWPYLTDPRLRYDRGKSDGALIVRVPF